MNSFDDLYKHFYNALIEISNGEVFTIHYLFSKKWKVCNSKDTVIVAYNALMHAKQYVSELKNWEENKRLENKISKMFDTLVEINNSKSDTWDDGLFDSVTYYYADDTVYKAQKCLKIINEYI